MDNKYGLGSAKVSHVAHERHTTHTHSMVCRYCGGEHLILSPTMNDHFCKDCGKYQSDVPAGYSTGRSADY